MKRILVIACILAVSALPAMVSAQGLPSLGGIPGVGALGSLFGNIGPYGESTTGLLAPPTFYVGYLYAGKGANFGVGLDDSIGAIFGLDHTYRLSGLALGLSGAITISDRMSVIASGWCIVSTANNTSTERYDGAGFRAERIWSAETNWWWLDALVAYNLGGGVAALGGVRFDRFETKFKNPEAIFNFGASPTDESNVQSNGYIPLLGLLYSTGGSERVLTAYAVGFPTLLGHVDYHESILIVTTWLDASGDYNSGYFFETGLDYKRRFMGEAYLGAFFRYNATRGTFSGTFVGNPAAGSSPFRGGLNRTSFTFGGSLNLPFRLPFI